MCLSSVSSPGLTLVARVVVLHCPGTSFTLAVVAPEVSVDQAPCQVICILNRQLNHDSQNVARGPEPQRGLVTCPRSHRHGEVMAQSSKPPSILVSAHRLALPCVFLSSPTDSFWGPLFPFCFDTRELKCVHGSHLSKPYSSFLVS